MNAYETLDFRIPETLAATCAMSHEGREWIAKLPDVVDELCGRWKLSIDMIVEGENVTASWVALVSRENGTGAVLKVGMPHKDTEYEIEALRILKGKPTVMLLDADRHYNAMLLEECAPGTTLRIDFQPDQDVIIAGLLKKFWITPKHPHPFLPLSKMIRRWSAKTRAVQTLWHEDSTIKHGLDLFERLCDTTMDGVLLATDLHAGNVLASLREPWLVIDPKPYIGDRAYDATPHLLTSRDRMRSDPLGTMQHFANCLDVSYDRVCAWTFARLAAEPRDDWDDEAMAIAKIIRPHVPRIA
jgi:streptomycin 6-kinase